MATTVITDWHDLISRHRAGEAAATAELVRAAIPIIQRAVGGRTRFADADDALQEALYTVVLKVGDMNCPAAFPGWVSVVAQRAAYDIVRRQRRTVPTSSTKLDELRSEQGLDDDAIVTRLDARIDAPRIEDELDRLTPRERDVVLYFARNEDASYADAAERLACPIGSLGPTRQRALRKLRGAPGLAAAG